MGCGDWLACCHAAPARAGWHGVCDHRGRDGRYAGHRMARPVRQASPGAREPGDGDHWACVDVGRDCERDCHGAASRTVWRNHAAIPRLALRLSTFCGDGDASSSRTASTNGRGLGQPRGPCAPSCGRDKSSPLVGSGRCGGTQTISECSVVMLAK